MQKGKWRQSVQELPILKCLNPVTHYWSKCKPFWVADSECVFNMCLDAFSKCKDIFVYFEWAWVCAFERTCSKCFHIFVFYCHMQKDIKNETSLRVKEREIEIARWEKSSLRKRERERERKTNKFLCNGLIFRQLGTSWEKLKGKMEP